MINENRVNYFLSLAHNKSITKTAEQLFMSQQSLSKQIAALEEDVGFKLFVRTYNGVKLTPAGETMYDFFFKTSEEYKRLKSFHTDLFCNLCIGHHTGLDTSVFREQINYALLNYPTNFVNSVFLVDEPSTNELQEKLISCELDLVLYPKYMHINNPGISTRSVASVPMCYFFSDSLAGSLKTPEDFANVNIYLPEYSGQLPDDYLSFFSEYFASSSKYTIRRPPSFGAKLDSITWGTGVALEPSLSLMHNNTKVCSLELDMQTDIICAIKTGNDNQCVRYLFDNLSL